MDPRTLALEDAAQEGIDLAWPYGRARAGGYRELSECFPTQPLPQKVTIDTHIFRRKMFSPYNNDLGQKYSDLGPASEEEFAKGFCAGLLAIGGDLNANAESEVLPPPDSLDEFRYTPLNENRGGPCGVLLQGC